MNYDIRTRLLTDRRTESADQHYDTTKTKKQAPITTPIFHPCFPRIMPTQKSHAKSACWQNHHTLTNSHSSFNSFLHAHHHTSNRRGLTLLCVTFAGTFTYPHHKIFAIIIMPFSVPKLIHISTGSLGDTQAGGSMGGWRRDPRV